MFSCAQRRSHQPVIASRSSPAHGATRLTLWGCGTRSTDSEFQRGTKLSVTPPSGPWNCSSPP